MLDAALVTRNMQFLSFSTSYLVATSHPCARISQPSTGGAEQPDEARMRQGGGGIFGTKGTAQLRGSSCTSTEMADVYQERCKSDFGDTEGAFSSQGGITCEQPSPRGSDLGEKLFGCSLMNESLHCTL